MKACMPSCAGFSTGKLAEQVAQMWALREKSAVVKAEAVLASAGLTTESVIAQDAGAQDRRHRARRSHDGDGGGPPQLGPARNRPAPRKLRADGRGRVVQDVEDAEEIEGPGCKLMARMKPRANARARCGVSAARRREPDRSDSKCEHRTADHRRQGALGAATRAVTA
jgi:hypothetical protein